MPNLGITFWVKCGLLAVCCFGWHSMRAQLDRHELAERIALTDRLLDETRNREAKSLVTLRTLNQQILMRTELVRQLTEEVTYQQAQVEKLDLILCEMETDAERIQDNYIRTVKAAYQELGTDNLWLAILSADGFSDAFYRLQYFRQFSQYRREQLNLIDRTHQDLESQQEVLLKQVIEKDRILSLQREQLLGLEDNRREQRELYRSLKSQARDYQRRLALEQTQLNSLLREAENIYQATREKKVASDYARTFLAKKGELDWPVAPHHGIVVGHFGRSEDPFGNPITNEGIFIRTPAEEEVKSVYAGRVTGLTHLPMDGGWVVIIEHGRYRSVYANLEKVFVQEGQLLSTGQPLGLVRSDHRTGETVLQFLIYTLPNRFLDPEKWLHS